MEFLSVGFGIKWSAELAFSFSATNINKVSGGGSSIALSSLFPAVAQKFRHPHDQNFIIDFQKLLG